MFFPEWILAPHQGQFVSWAGVPLPLPLYLPPCSCWIASAAASVVFGVVFCPTHSPMRNGSLPHVFSSLRRMTSQAQIRAVARWNCWIVSNRSVYRINTATPNSPVRPATVPWSRRRPIV